MRGQGGSDDELAAARAALYRPDVDDAARDRYARLLAIRSDRWMSADADERSASAQADGVGREDEEIAVRERRRRPVVAAGAVLVALVAAVAWLQQSSASRPAPGPTAEADGPIARLVLTERQRLPVAWRGADLVTASDVLDGAVPLTAPDGHGRSRLLLVVRCPAADRSFQVVVTGGTPVPPRYGACGRLQVVALPPGLDGPVGVVVTTRGPSQFSGALLRR